MRRERVNSPMPPSGYIAMSHGVIKAIKEAGLVI